MSDTDTSVIEVDDEAREADKRRQWVADLHALAEFVAAHPDLDLPDSYGVTVHVFVYGDEDGDHKAELARLARALGRCQKTSNENYFSLVRAIGMHEVKVLAPRSSVCERVVVGTRKVEREVYPDDVKPTTEVVDEEVVEWRCPESLLAVAAFDEATQ